MRSYVSEFLYIYNDEIDDMGSYKVEFKSIDSINDIFSDFDSVKKTTRFIKAIVISSNGSAIAKNDRSSVNSFALDLSRASGNTKEYIIKNCATYKGCDLLLQAYVSDSTYEKRLELTTILEKNFNIDKYNL